MLHLCMLDKIETGLQDTAHIIDDADVDDILDRHYDTDALLP